MNNIYDNDSFFDAYSQMARSQGGLEAAGEWHQLRPLFPPLEGKAVLDMGCGYGWHSKFAADGGASQVYAFDLSEKMIQEARARNPHPSITYAVEDMEAYAYPENTYDLAISNLALHYIADLDGIFAKVFRTLRKGGVFLLNIEHPVFTAGVNEDWIYDDDGRPAAWPIDNYFYPGPRQTNFLGQAVTKEHHTLSQILMGLINGGFSLQVVEEAMPPENMLDIPGMKDEMRRPMMLLVRAVKPEG